ncbi:hypothetical protein SFHH103_04094 (plasmid) [Sinorhizobium fredii HH103]|uniref:Uncharacterized protein n=1 Tax=Sinorhizobium fredii (strain HH103) TaxID=1117943 RepID=G9AC05_SINF1|nr:hypothetical protein SFHH103_04094 [Sinorhizobium fredii HH103]
MLHSAARRVDDGGDEREGREPEDPDPKKERLVGDIPAKRWKGEETNEKAVQRQMTRSRAAGPTDRAPTRFVPKRR